MVNISSDSISLAVAGGFLIAIATSINFVVNGRITGMSGILNALTKPDLTTYWKSCILSGLILSSGAAFHLHGFYKTKGSSYLLEPPESFKKGINFTSLFISGLLVGLGTKLSNGCTSGHGVCGLPRLSLRSLAAVLTFMFTSTVMANFKYQVLPLLQDDSEGDYNRSLYVNGAIIISLVITGFSIIKNNEQLKGLIERAVSLLVGFIFGAGLLISGMANKSKVLSFLTFNEDWDPSLIFVMASAVLFNLVSFNYVIYISKRPILAHELTLPTQTKIDSRLILGAAIFGLGWGLSGICPGPAMLITPIYPHSMVKFMPGMVIGQYIGYIIERRSSREEVQLLM